MFFAFTPAKSISASCGAWKSAGASGISKSPSFFHFLPSVEYSIFTHLIPRFVYGFPFAWFSFQIHIRSIL